MIPKIAHFYWGEEKLPYLRYLTLKSFCQHNPDWAVNYYVPKHRSHTKTWPTHEHQYELQGRDYTQCLAQLRIAIFEIDFADIGVSNNFPEVHKSDFLRWNILSNVGGLWSDMDILYFRPLGMDLHCSTYICHNPSYGHSIGFLLACEKNPVYRLAAKMSGDNYDPKNYQAVGSVIMNRINSQVYELDPATRNIQMDIVYAYNALNINEIYSPRIEGECLRFTDKSIGIHWYAGHGLAGDFQNGKIRNCLLLDFLKKGGCDAEFYNSIGHS